MVKKNNIPGQTLFSDKNITTKGGNCDDPLHEIHDGGNMTPFDMFLYNFRYLWRLMHIWCVVPLNNAKQHSSKKIEEQKREARRARDRLNYTKKHPI